MTQELKAGKNGMFVGKAVVVAALGLLCYVLYLAVSGLLGYDGCPQFRRGDSIVILGWCGDPSLYWAYVFGGLISLVLGVFVFLSALTRHRQSYDVTKTRIAIEIILTTIAVVFLGISVFLISANFHVDYYG